MTKAKLAGVISGIAVLGASAAAVAQIANGVPSANPRAGSPVNIVATGYFQKAVEYGTDPLENPSGPITRYGYLNDQPATSASNPFPEPTKTEPDGNTFLRLPNPGGPTAGYNYGGHFLFTSH